MINVLKTGLEMELARRSGHSLTGSTKVELDNK